MAIACKKEATPRVFHSLQTTPFVNRLLGGPLHGLLLQHVQRRLPAGSVREVDAPGNPAYGWLDAGGVVVNTARPVRADTPLHELTHLWLLMLRSGKNGDDGRRYRELSQQLIQEPAYQQLAARYPLSATYQQSDQVEEVTATLVGQLAAQRAGLAQVPVVGRLLALAERLVGRYLGLPGVGVLSKPLHALVSQLSDEILAEAPLDVDPAWLAQHVGYARYQGMEVPANTTELLNQLSGVGTSVSESQLRTKAADGLRQVKGGATTILLPDPLGGSNPIQLPVGHLDLTAREDAVISHYRQLEASQQALAGDGALTLLALPTEQLGKILAGDYKELPAHPTYSRESLIALAQELGKAFYGMQPQDSVVRYSKDALPDGVYDPGFDDGMTLLHVKPRRKGDGSTVTEVVLVRLASNPQGAAAADLTNKRHDKPLLAGLYSGSWGAAAKGWANRKLFNLKLKGSVHDRSMLAGTALALHLSAHGYHVSGVGVGKIDMQSTPTAQHNDVRVVPITEYLEAWQTLGRIADVRELLPPRLRELLAQPKLLQTLTYEQDFLRNLRAYVEGEQNLSAVATALGEYEAAGRQNSARGLLRAIEGRLRELRKVYGNEALYQKSREVVVLGQAHRQLKGIMPLANKHADLGKLEQFWRGFNAGDNPALQWFYESWREARERSVDRFLIYQAERIDRTQELIDEAHRSGRVSFNPAYHDEGKYYQRLFQTSTQIYTDAKGQERQMEFNEHRFKMPGTSEFAALDPMEKRYIEWTLATMKEMAIERYVRENARGREPSSKLRAKAADWYESTWGRGYVPIITGDVTQVMMGSAKAGEANGQALDVFQRQLDENLTYDDQTNSNMNTLGERFGLQAGEGPHGSDARLKALGLLAVQQLNPATGQIETTYVIDPDQGRVRNLSLEPNFRRALDQFMMSNIKNLQATDLQTKKLTATAMIRYEFGQSGLLRGLQAQNEDGTDAALTSNVEKNLNTMYEMLVLGNRNQMVQSEGIRRLGYWLATGGKVASLAALGFSVKTAAASQVSNVFNALDVGLANLGQEHGLTLPAMTAALGEFKNMGKLIAIGRQERTFDMDEMSLLEEWTQNGEGLSGLKASDFLNGNESFILDRMGDMAVRLWLTAAQMKQNGTWEAYEWNEQEGKLTYSESKHRAQAGDAQVDAIKRRMLETGELELDEKGNPLPMQRANDDRMRGSIESFNQDVLGPYKEEVGTIMGSNIFLRMIQKFRVYALKRIDDWTKGERSNVNKGYYDKETAQWVSSQEIGLFTSLTKLMAGTALHKGMAWKTWEELSAADKFNLKRAGAGTAVTMAALLLAEALFGDDDEKQRKKDRSLKQYVLHSLSQDQFLVSQLGVVHQAVTSPMVVIDFMDRTQAAFGDYLTGDFTNGNRTMKRNLGIFKTADWLEQVFGIEDEPVKKK